MWGLEVSRLWCMLSGRAPTLSLCKWRRKGGKNEQEKGEREEETRPVLFGSWNHHYIWIDSLSIVFGVFLFVFDCPFYFIFSVCVNLFEIKPCHFKVFSSLGILEADCCRVYRDEGETRRGANVSQTRFNLFHIHVHFLFCATSHLSPRETAVLIQFSPRKRE